MFTFDVETLGVESTSVILSAALVHWSPTEDFSYDQLVQRACFVKFDVKVQAGVGRLVDKRTLEWWMQQGPYQRKRSFTPSENDVHPIIGIAKLAEYYKQHASDNNAIWIRGSLDQMAIDSLSRVFKTEDIAPYNVYRDIRTAIDILVDGAKNGYCEAPGLQWDKVIKHDPVHDIASDTMMLRYGK